MHPVTLITDLGTKDFYLGAVKGVFFSYVPELKLIDITHQVAPFNIIEAAFILKNSYHHFPEGTIHVISVDTSYSNPPRYIVLYHNGHHFIGPDNGVFSLAFESRPEKIIELNLPQDQRFKHFPLPDIFVKAACHLAQGGAPEVIGKLSTSLTERSNLLPSFDEQGIRGNVIYIDRFENVITNIDRDIFEKVGQGRRFRILFRRGESLDRISENYQEVPEGEKLCLFSVSGFLEIAINKGGASGLLGLRPGETVRIEFFN